MAPSLGELNKSFSSELTDDSWKIMVILVMNSKSKVLQSTSGAKTVTMFSWTYCSKSCASGTIMGSSTLSGTPELAKVPLHKMDWKFRFGSTKNRFPSKLNVVAHALWCRELSHEKRKKALAWFYFHGIVLYSWLKAERFGFHKTIVPKVFLSRVQDQRKPRYRALYAEGIESFDLAHWRWWHAAVNRLLARCGRFKRVLGTESQGERVSGWARWRSDLTEALWSDSRRATTADSMIESWMTLKVCFCVKSFEMLPVSSIFVGNFTSTCFEYKHIDHLSI